MISYFQEFCGVEFSEKNLSKFATYFERTGHEECIYYFAQEYLRIFLLIVKTTAIFCQGKKSCIAKTAQDWGVILPV